MRIKICKLGLSRKSSIGMSTEEELKKINELCMKRVPLLYLLNTLKAFKYFHFGAFLIFNIFTFVRPYRDEIIEQLYIL